MVGAFGVSFYQAKYIMDGESWRNLEWFKVQIFSRKPSNNFGVANAGFLSNSLTELFIRLRMIWDELDKFIPESICNSSVKCSGRIVTLISQEIKQRIILCNSWADCYTVSCQVYVRHCYSVACSYCGKYWSYRICMLKEMWFSINSENKDTRNTNNKRVSTHYGRNTHIIDVC